MTVRYLITGGLGCIGAWTIARLSAEGHYIVAVDLGQDRSRLRLVTGGSDLEDAVMFARADITDRDLLGSLVAENRIERIIHLAALQIPASHADPPAGASANVVGTANVFDIARHTEVESVVFASSVAVYGPELVNSRRPVASDAAQNPANFYGVYKRADEAVALLYHRHYGVRSVGLRPHTVYGPGRDTGLTSSPTWAMLATVLGRDYEIPFSGAVGLQHASDVAETFIRASAAAGDGRAYSIRGNVTTMDRLAQLLNDRSTGAAITVTGVPLPFPPDLDETDLSALLGEVPCMALEEGLDVTIRHFANAEPGLLPEI